MYKLFVKKEKNNLILVNYDLNVNLFIILLSIINAIITLDSFKVNDIIQFLVLSSFIVIVFVDLKDMIIPDTLILFNIILICLMYLEFNKAIFGIYQFVSSEIIYSIVFVSIILSIIIFIHIFYKVEIMGYGDIKLLYVMGLMSGFIKLLFILFISSFIALIIEMPQIKRKKSGFPFGPYLISAFVIMHLFGDKLISFVFGGY